MDVEKSLRNVEEKVAMAFEGTPRTGSASGASGPPPPPPGRATSVGTTERNGNDDDMGTCTTGSAPPPPSLTGIASSSFGVVDSPKGEGDAGVDGDTSCVTFASTASSGVSAFSLAKPSGGVKALSPLTGGARERGGIGKNAPAPNALRGYPSCDIISTSSLADMSSFGSPCGLRGLPPPFEAIVDFGTDPTAGTTTATIPSGACDITKVTSIASATSPLHPIEWGADDSVQFDNEPPPALIAREVGSVDGGNKGSRETTGSGSVSGSGSASGAFSSPDSTKPSDVQRKAAGGGAVGAGGVAAEHQVMTPPQRARAATQAMAARQSPTGKPPRMGARETSRREVDDGGPAARVRSGAISPSQAPASVRAATVNTLTTAAGAPAVVDRTFAAPPRQRSPAFAVPVPPALREVGSRTTIPQAAAPHTRIAHRDATMHVDSTDTFAVFGVRTRRAPAPPPATPAPSPPEGAPVMRGAAEGAASPVARPSSPTDPPPASPLSEVPPLSSDPTHAAAARRGRGDEGAPPLHTDDADDVASITSENVGAEVKEASGGVVAVASASATSMEKRVGGDDASGEDTGPVETVTEPAVPGPDPVPVPVPVSVARSPAAATNRLTRSGATRSRSRAATLSASSCFGPAARSAARNLSPGVVLPPPTIVVLPPASDGEGDGQEDSPQIRAKRVATTPIPVVIHASPPSPIPHPHPQRCRQEELGPGLPPSHSEEHAPVPATPTHEVTEVVCSDKNTPAAPGARRGTAETKDEAELVSAPDAAGREEEHAADAPARGESMQESHGQEQQQTDRMGDTTDPAARDAAGDIEGTCHGGAGEAVERRTGAGDDAVDEQQPTFIPSTGDRGVGGCDDRATRLSAPAAAAATGTQSTNLKEPPARRGGNSSRSDDSAAPPAAPAVPVSPDTDRRVAASRMDTMPQADEQVRALVLASPPRTGGSPSPSSPAARYGADTPPWRRPQGHGQLQHRCGAGGGPSGGVADRRRSLPRAAARARAWGASSSGARGGGGGPHAPDNELRTTPLAQAATASAPGAEGKGAPGRGGVEDDPAEKRKGKTARSTPTPTPTPTPVRAPAAGLGSETRTPACTARGGAPTSAPAASSPQQSIPPARAAVGGNDGGGVGRLGVTPTRRAGNSGSSSSSVSTQRNAAVPTSPLGVRRGLWCTSSPDLSGSRGGCRGPLGGMLPETTTPPPPRPPPRVCEYQTADEVDAALCEALAAASPLRVRQVVHSVDVAAAAAAVSPTAAPRTDFLWVCRSHLEAMVVGGDARGVQMMLEARPRCDLTTDGDGDNNANTSRGAAAVADAGAKPGAVHGVSDDPEDGEGLSAVTADDHRDSRANDAHAGDPTTVDRGATEAAAVATPTPARNTRCWRDVYNADGDDGCTLLATAAAAGHVDVVAVMLAACADADGGGGVDVNEVGGDGLTALHHAARRGRHEACAVLLARGAAVDCRAVEHRHRTPLAMAAEDGHPRTCVTLLTGGADVNARDTIGESPLALAARHGHAPVCQLLAAMGACADAQNHRGETAVDAATAGGHVGVARLLRGALMRLPRA